MLNPHPQIQMRTKPCHIILRFDTLHPFLNEGRDGLDAFGDGLFVDAGEGGDFFEGAGDFFLTAGEEEAGGDEAVVGFAFGVVFVEYFFVEVAGGIGDGFGEADARVRDESTVHFGVRS